MSPEGRPHIVLIEDRDEDVFLVEYSLQKHSLLYDLTRFEDGETALQAVTGRRALRRPDLVLLDLNLPRRNGREILKALRANPALADTPVAVITSSFAPKDREDALLLGADRYVQKPSNLSEFIKVVADVVNELIALGSGKTAAAAGRNSV